MQIQPINNRVSSNRISQNNKNVNFKKMEHIICTGIFNKDEPWEKVIISKLLTAKWVEEFGKKYRFDAILNVTGFSSLPYGLSLVPVKEQKPALKSIWNKICKTIFGKDNVILLEHNIDKSLPNLPVEIKYLQEETRREFIESIEDEIGAVSSLKAALELALEKKNLIGGIKKEVYDKAVKILQENGIF